MMADSDEEEEQTALVCDNGLPYTVTFFVHFLVITLTVMLTLTV